jgi:hypothetical protein
MADAAPATIAWAAANGALATIASGANATVAAVRKAPRNGSLRVTGIAGGAPRQ